MNTSPLPVKRDLSQLYTLSLLVGLLMTLASLAGIFFQSFLYPIEEMCQSFVTTDVINLFIGLPVLIGSLWFARRDRLIGLLFWLGVLFYVIYNYVAYLIAMSRTILFLPSRMDTDSLSNLL